MIEESGIVWDCSLCGYDRCTDALELHHTDLSKKETTVSKILTYSEKEILDEIKGGIVLCANCHREFHTGIW